MIHSLSGGIVADNEVRTYAKVRVGELPAWYLAPFRVAAGDRVLVPVSSGTAEGVVERVEACSPHTAPVSPRRAREILSLLPENP